MRTGKLASVKILFTRTGHVSAHEIDILRFLNAAAAKSPAQRLRPGAYLHRMPFTIWTLSRACIFSRGYALSARVSCLILRDTGVCVAYYAAGTRGKLIIIRTLL